MVGGILILIGAIFLFVNVFRIDFGDIWPIIFFIIGAGFYLPVLLMPRDRRNLAGLLDSRHDSLRPGRDLLLQHPGR